MAKKSATGKKAPRAPSAAPIPLAAITGAVELIGNAPTDGKRVTERGVVAIELMAVNGRALPSIAKAIGVDRKTLMRMAERQPEVAEAIERGRGALSDELHDLLMSQARRGNTVAAIFLAKWRLGARDNGPVQDSTPKVAIQINLPQPKDVESYMRTIVSATQDAG